MSQKRLLDQMDALAHLRAKCEWLQENTEGLIQEEIDLMGSQINSVIEMLCYLKITDAPVIDMFRSLKIPDDKGEA